MIKMYEAELVIFKEDGYTVKEEITFPSKSEALMYARNPKNRVDKYEVNERWYF